MTSVHGGPVPRLSLHTILRGPGNASDHMGNDARDGTGLGRALVGISCSFVVLGIRVTCCM